MRAYDNWCTKRMTIWTHSKNFELSVAECSGPKHRSDMIIGTGMGWTVGYISLPLLAFIVRDYQYMIWFSVFCFTITLFWFHFLWESPRWLIVRGHVDKARDVLKNAHALNQRNVNDFEQQFNQLITHLQKKDNKRIKDNVNVLDLVRTRRMRTNTLILSYCSVVTALVYYGFSVNMFNFGDNFYSTFALSGLTEVPSLLVVMVSVRWLGRTPSLCGSLLITSLASVAAIVLPIGRHSWLQMASALIGKFAVTSAVAVLDINATELFPTVVRNCGLALLLLIARVGSSVAPFMGNVVSIVQFMPLFCKLSLHVFVIAKAALYGQSVVMIFYALTTCLAAILAIHLPETKDKDIDDFVDEVENPRQQELTTSETKF